MTLPFHFKVQTIIEKGKISTESLNEVQNWLTTTNLPQIQEQFIALFLLSCENDVISTKKTIESYFRIKKKHPDFFDHWDIESEEMKKICEVVDFCIIPKRLNNAVVILVKLIDFNYKNFNVFALLKLSLMLIALSQNSNPPNELIAILDAEGINFMHLSCVKMKPMLAHIEFVQEALPLKIREIHILNSNYVFERVIGIFRMFIRSDLISSIKTHSSKMSMEEFHKKYVPCDFLPKDYNGELPFIKELKKNTVHGLKEMTAFYQAEEKLRSVCN